MMGYTDVGWSSWKSGKTFQFNVMSSKEERDLVLIILLFQGIFASMTLFQIINCTENHVLYCKLLTLFNCKYLI